MARNSELGEFEQLVLLAVLRLNEKAYALAIAQLLEERARREMSRATLYAALDRLEAKGFLEWRIEAPVPGRAGHRRRRFKATVAGREALAATRAVLLDMWDGVELLPPGHRG